MARQRCSGVEFITTHSAQRSALFPRSKISSNQNIILFGRVYLISPGKSNRAYRAWSWWGGEVDAATEVGSVERHRRSGEGCRHQEILVH